MPGPRVNVTSTRAIVAAAQRRGVDRDALLSRHGVASAVLDDPDARLEASLVDALWTDATTSTGEPDLAVLAAVELPWGAYRVIDYLAGHSDSLGDAIQVLGQHFGLINDAVRLEVTSTDDGATMRLGMAGGGAIPSRYVDYALAACVYRMTYVIGADVHPTVRLRREPPVDSTPHIQAFGTEVLFGQAVDEVHFDRELWSTPSRSPDPGLRAVLHTHAEQLQANIGIAPPLLVQLRTEVESGLPHGRTELARVARRLGTSPRTLQRRLGELGLTWRTFIGSLQDELAKTYLRDPTLSVEEVATLVGFAEATSFNRSFVRTTGQTPGAWRHTH